MKMSKMRILRRRQQLPVPARIAPGPEPILPQVSVHRLKPQHLVLTPAVISSELAGQHPVDYLKLGANQLDPKSIGKRLQH